MRWRHGSGPWVMRRRTAAAATLPPCRQTRQRAPVPPRWTPAARRQPLAARRPTSLRSWGPAARPACSGQCRPTASPRRPAREAGPATRQAAAAAPPWGVTALVEVACGSAGDGLRVIPATSGRRHRSSSRRRRSTWTRRHTPSRRRCLSQRRGEWWSDAWWCGAPAAGGRWQAARPPADWRPGGRHTGPHPGAAGGQRAAWRSVARVWRRPPPWWPSCDQLLPGRRAVRPTPQPSPTSARTARLPGG